MLQYFTFIGEPTFGIACIIFNFLVLLTASITRWRPMLQAIKAMRHPDMAHTEDEPCENAPRTAGSLKKTPVVSIIIPARNESALLEANLPRILGQDSDLPYEVIVADQNSTDNTALLIERLQKEHENLRSTFIPASSRNIEPRKLAITLGIRASRTEWVILINAGCEPASANWLNEWATHLSDGRDFVCLYSNYDYDHTSHTRRAIFERLMRQTQRHAAWMSGHITGSENCNLAIRKSWFLKNSGFAESLQLPFGEESIMANLHAKPERTLIGFAREAKCTEESPSQTFCSLLRIYDAETRRHLSHAARCRHRLYATGNLIIHLGIWCYVLYTAARCAHDVGGQSYSMDFLPIDASMAALCLGTIIPTHLLLNRLTDLLGETHLGWCLVADTCLAPWRMLKVALLRYAHRQEFVRDYLQSHS